MTKCKAAFTSEVPLALRTAVTPGTAGVLHSAGVPRIAACVLALAACGEADAPIIDVETSPLSLEGTSPVDPANPPQYPDGAERTEHAYFNATMEHIAHPDGAPGNYDAVTAIRSMHFFDTPRESDGLTAPGVNWAMVPDIIESGVAIYNFAGWWDAFARSSFEVFATLEETNPSRVAAWPMYRQGISPAASIGADPLRPAPRAVTAEPAGRGRQHRAHDHGSSGRRGRVVCGVAGDSGPGASIVGRTVKHPAQSA